MGYHLKDEELELDMKLLDLNGDGQIGYNEFVQWWKTENRFAQLQWSPDRLKLIDALTEKFRQFDKDGSGKIDKKEFSALHRDLLASRHTTSTLDQCLKVNVFN